MTTTLYAIALVNLLIGTGAIYLALIPSLSIKWHYYHYFLRKPLAWSLLLFATAVAVLGSFSTWHLIPWLLTALGVALTYKMHQEVIFEAVDFPSMSTDPTRLPLKSETEMAYISYQGINKAYPLAYVEHHHIINDRFGDRIVSLTYCAMCRSIIPFDVTDLGPLFVGGFKNGNMIVADRRTVTYFQQSTFQSVIGKLHPRALEMIPFQILKWQDVQGLPESFQVPAVTEHDFRAFELPIPGIWTKIIESEVTPGLAKKNIDKSYPARTRVIGIKGQGALEPAVYIKEELISKQIHHDKLHGMFFIAMHGEILAFRDTASGQALELELDQNLVKDRNTGTYWSLSGKKIKGDLPDNLSPYAISDEYWFSWKFFHPATKLEHP